jgi:hypothetical protein
MPPGIGYPRPMFSAREQEFDVEPGTLRFGVGGKMQDYSQHRPINMEPQGIPSSLQGRSYLRPLLQGNSDGSPMSLADMESRQNAMTALDDFFTNAPAEQELRESAAAAELRKQDALAEDPLFVERGKAQLQFDQQDALAQLSEHRRQQMLSRYADELSDTESRYAASIEKAKAAGRPDLVAKLEEELERNTAGLGTRYGFMGEDQRNILIKPPGR